MISIFLSHIIYLSLFSGSSTSRQLYTNPVYSFYCVNFPPPNLVVPAKISFSFSAFFCNDLASVSGLSNYLFSLVLKAMSIEQARTMINIFPK